MNDLTEQQVFHSLICIELDFRKRTAGVAVLLKEVQRSQNKVSPSSFDSINSFNRNRRTWIQEHCREGRSSYGDQELKLENILHRFRRCSLNVNDSNKQQHSSGNKFSSWQSAVSSQQQPRQFIVVSNRNVSDSPQVWHSVVAAAKRGVTRTPTRTNAD
ncbi:unnamed protein product [Ceratitis capitata]|uniref:(Mediterranean fruit fly) hypothetical protein n=1 Tax=Ceratitis capitata TaxID=7213 RepID=A0A811V6W1_CERCA|nr:unnamed protein product [Ceratitis capitata]